jgi:6-phosphogluconolactonase
LDSETGKLSPLGVQAILEAAAWLEKHPNLPVLYSVAHRSGGQEAEGDILSYEIDKTFGKLYLINRVNAGGADPTHMAIDPVSETIFVANFKGSTVAAFPLQSDGSLGYAVSVVEDYGSGPHPRQEKAEPHGVAVDPSLRYLLCSDFGADRIFVYKFDGTTRALAPAATPFVAVPPGSGPRHLVFHPNGLFLYGNNELSAEVCTYSFDSSNGSLKLLQTLSTYPAGWNDPKSSGEIGISRDGRFVYVTLRQGQDAIVAYAVNKDGTLTEIQRISSQGETPRSYGFDPTGKWMLVTNEGSNSVDVFSVDSETGKLKATGESLSVPKPQTVVFFAD